MSLLRIYTSESQTVPYMTVAFWCPGCRTEHPYRVVAPGFTEADVRATHPNGCWAWNGSMEKPSFTPSLMCNPNREDQCHLYVTDGKLLYCGDCHHDLRGQIMDMVPIPSDEELYGYPEAD